MWSYVDVRRQADNKWSTSVLLIFSSFYKPYSENNAVGSTHTLNLYVDILFWHYFSLFNTVQARKYINWKQELTKNGVNFDAFIHFTYLKLIARSRSAPFNTLNVCLWAVTFIFSIFKIKQLDLLINAFWRI